MAVPMTDKCNFVNLPLFSRNFCFENFNKDTKNT